MNPRFFDSHAHLDGAELSPELPAVLERAAHAGLTDIICIGASEGFTSNEKALAVVDAHPPAGPVRLFATVGVHPHDARICDQDTLVKVEALAAHPRVVAIGETGLDYHYQHSGKDEQLAAFRAFLRMARRRKLPAVIHTREAEDDTIRVLEEEDAASIGGVIHCFTGSEKLARAAVELGFYVSFSGVLTFRNADPLREICRALPRDKVLVETDCPYLAPVPHRGKRNEPAYVVKTAECVAQLWGQSLDWVRAKTGENAARLFGC